MSTMLPPPPAHRPILVIGAGIAGMTAALHIAEAGRQALLVDQAPAIGGALPLLDKTFPTDSCAVCFAAPDFPAICPYFECERHPNIRLRAGTTLEALEGGPGDFSATLITGPRQVDPQRCTGCGLCALACPESAPAGILGADWPGEARKAIDRPFPQALPEAYVIDEAACTRCGACVEACPHGAIDMQAKATRSTEQVSAVLLAPGFGPSDAHVQGAYGYGVYPDVVTSLEFERMLSTSSPGRGLPFRPSDGQAARRIAIIHCVGSRDQQGGAPYCSGGCCMIAAKQASLAVRRDPGATVTLFTMDVRAAGRGYERYLAAVRDHPRIAYHRSLVSGVRCSPRTHRLRLQYAEGHRARADVFDLVVLQVGMVVPPGVRDTAARLGVRLNPDGFAVTGPRAPVETSRPGVFTAGAFREPKDIAAAVVEAAAAASRALAVSGFPPPEPLPLEPAGISKRPTFYDAPRIGVFLDAGDPDLANALDFAELAKAVSGIPGVAHVSLSAECAHIRASAQENDLSGVVAGVRSARRNGHHPEGVAGQPVTWLALGAADVLAHPHQPAQTVFQKALDLLHMAVLRATRKVPVVERHFLPEACAVVLGGGLAGLLATGALSESGLETHIVERAAHLGGWLRDQPGEQAVWLARLSDEIAARPGVRVHLESRAHALRGRPGQRRLAIETPDGTLEIPCGALVVATGAQTFRPPGFGLDDSPAVLTQPEFGKLLAGWAQGEAPPQAPGLVVMVQCAGTRQGERPYCSKTCCADALRNALALKSIFPATRVAILYRDIVTPGLNEHLYTQARRGGVEFIRCASKGFAIEPGSSMYVMDDVLGEMLHLEPDWLVLSGGVEPDLESRSLAGVLGLPLNEDGFFRAAHTKSRPVDTPEPGVFVAGLAGGPATFEETIEQGLAAGLRAALYIRRPIRTSATLATVDERLCSGCGLCVDVCPNGARSLEPYLGIARVDAFLCSGCGMCVAVCPNGASGQSLHETAGILHALDTAVQA